MPDQLGFAEETIDSKYLLEQRSSLLRQTIGVGEGGLSATPSITGVFGPDLAIVSRRHRCVCDNPVLVKVAHRPKGVDDETTPLVGKSPERAGRAGEARWKRSRADLCLEVGKVPHGRVVSYHVRSDSVCPAVHVRVADGEF